MPRISEGFVPGRHVDVQHNGKPARAMRALDAVQRRGAAVGATANALTATSIAPLRSFADFLTRRQATKVSSTLRRVRRHSLDSRRLRPLERTHFPLAVPACPSAKGCLRKTEPGDDKTPPDFPLRPASAKRSPSPGDAPTSASGVHPLPGPLRGLLLPDRGIQPDPPAHPYERRAAHRSDRVSRHANSAHAQPSAQAG